MQISMFDGTKVFKIDKPIRLISLFSGYDSQALALKYLNVNFKHYKTCEWAVKSIQALKDLHFKDDITDYSKNLTQDEIIDYLTSKGISANYNEPMTRGQIKRLGEQKQRQIYNNIKASHNLVNIQQAKASDLEIVDVDKYCYLMTYSFPCQDLSKAGLSKGMEKGSGTRSGMLWEVERILDECENLPQILLMENVPDVIGSKNIIHFAKWLEKLEKLGYHCYWQVLNAKDFGVPQNRERCFMVSLLGDYLYEFPKKQKLEIRLKDILEKEVDEKYYLSSKAIEGSLKTNFASSKCVVEPQLMELTQNQPQGYRVYDTEGISVSLVANGGGMGAKTGLYMVNEPRICASRGRNPENPNSREKGLNTEQRLKLGPQGLSNTLTTVQKDNYLLEPRVLGGIGEKKSNGGKQYYQQDRIYDNNIAISVTTAFNPYYLENLRIRKLTPKECFRLMGVKDEDFDKVAQNQSNASLYHLSGDSIVVNVLMAIFSQML